MAYYILPIDPDQEYEKAVILAQARDFEQAGHVIDDLIDWIEASGKPPAKATYDELHQILTFLVAAMEAEDCEDVED